MFGLLFSRLEPLSIPDSISEFLVESSKPVSMNEIDYDELESEAKWSRRTKEHIIESGIDRLIPLRLGIVFLRFSRLILRYSWAYSRTESSF